MTEIYNSNTPEDAEPKAVSVTPKTPFEADLYDLAFALFAFALGYMFTSMVFFAWRGWGVTLFTAVYLLSVTAYLVKKDAFRGGLPAWFWFAVTLLTGASFSVWDNAGISQARSMFLFCSAVYYVVVATDSALAGKTGSFLPLDGVNAMLLIPFGNFANQYVSFARLKKSERGKGKRLPVLLGLLLAALMLAFLLPMLERADSGGFSRILSAARSLVTIDSAALTEITIYAVLAIPVAAYLFGLVSGAAHKRRVDTITRPGAEKAVGLLRILQPVTVFIVLGAVCGLYLLFILCQLPYFFSAFTGSRPEGFLVYSEYARRGFFELCGISVINLAAILTGNVTCKKRRCDSRALRAFNVILALITLVLIATAFSKLALYIGAYGLSMPRLLPCVFMVFLAAVFAGVIVLQWREFGLVRFALVTGCVMLCALCLANPDALVARYNADRYLSGTLADYDADILFRAGAAGVAPALEVYGSAPEGRVKSEVLRYLEAMKPQLHYGGDGSEMSYERYKARQRLGG